VKAVSGQIHTEGTPQAMRAELDSWMKTFPQPWTAAMEATIFTGWIYDAELKHRHPRAARDPTLSQLAGTPGNPVPDDLKRSG
jgi:hypothetical protein